MRALIRSPESGFVAFMQFLLCVFAASIAIVLIWLTASEEWAALPLWWEILASVVSLAAQAAALIMLVWAMQHRGLRTAMVSLVALLGMAALGVFGHIGGLHAAVLGLIGVAWLEIIRRTWPHRGFRRPRLRSNIFEPPRRASR